jgi:hypothetical protein
MMIRNLSPSWPPAVTVGLDKVPEATDIVLRAQRFRTDPYMSVTLRKETGAEYAAIISIAANLLDKAIVAINRKPGMTLRELGELDIE